MRALSETWRPEPAGAPAEDLEEMDTQLLAKDMDALKARVEAVEHRCEECRAERRENEKSLFAKLDALRDDMAKEFRELGWKVAALAVSILVAFLGAIVTYALRK